ncbi:MAG: hypothetical protein HYY16_17910 [Planctomycetes bacterium]|nr:hypothetical protein [Planctomycetota bacterium]
MWKTAPGSTGRLLQLCFAYFFFYVVTGVTVPLFQFYKHGPQHDGMAFLTYSTIGGTSICLAWVMMRGWYRLKSNRLLSLGRLSFPIEFLYVIPSGICTAVIIPTTTLMYSFKAMSGMVAMVFMRGSVIVISRIVDAVQTRQGILRKKVYAEENWAVAFALLAVSTHLCAGFFGNGKGKGGHFDFLGSPAAMTILSSYVVAYAVRIYIMNYYKNTRPKNVPYDNTGFFGVEQIAASVTLAVLGLALFAAPAPIQDVEQIALFRGSLLDPKSDWGWAILAGMAFGMVAFFSVFIFMFKGRTATFAGLVNRLTSLVAGTTATLIYWLAFGGKFPAVQDWASLAFILIAVGFLSVAEKKRALELQAPPEKGAWTGMVQDSATVRTS